MKRDTQLTICLILIVLILIFLITTITGVREYRTLEVKNIDLEKQLTAIQQEKEVYKEGPYTMITNLSSFMYINGISENIEGAVHWTDVNGVSGFDVMISGTHYRYVEGHILPPQLVLYAPNLRVEQ